MNPEISVAGAVDRLLRSSAGEANRLVLGYRAYMVERRLSSATINRRLAALRSLVRLARMLGVVVWAIEVPGLPVERLRDTRGPGVPAVRRMLRAAGHQAPAKAARDTALLRLLFDLALRRNEVVALDVAELERDALWIPIEELLPYSGHSKKSLPILLDYRDAIRDRQSELAARVAGAIDN